METSTLVLLVLLGLIAAFVLIEGGYNLLRIVKKTKNTKITIELDRDKDK
jgi:hypothetical protein